MASEAEAERGRAGSKAMTLMMERMYRRSMAPWETGVPCAEILRRLGECALPERGSALDLGCGTGVHSLLLAEHGLDVTGVDLSATAVEQARARLTTHPCAARVRFLVGDVLELHGIGEPFDVLLDRGCYHLVRSYALDAYRSVIRSLSHAGTWFILLASDSQGAALTPGLPVVDEQALRVELSDLFEIVDLRRCQVATRIAGNDELFLSVLLRRAQKLAQ